MDIFLLRGLIRGAGHWYGFPEKLREAFPDANIHYLEAPGTGRFYQHDSPLSIRKAVDFMRNEYMGDKDRQTQNILISISLGGMMAADWNKRYPGDFQKTVLMNSSFKGFSPLFKRVKPYALWQFIKAAFTTNTKKREETIVKLVSHNKKIREGLIESWTKNANEQPVSRKNALRQLISAARFTPGKTKPTGDFLVLSSKNDKLASSECSQKIAQTWDVPLIFHPWAGHSLPEDDPEWVVKQIKEWLNAST